MKSQPVTVAIELRLYTATGEQIDDFASECYGILLQPTGLSDCLAFSFEGPEGAENAAEFQRLLDSTFKRPVAKRKRSA